MLGPSLATLVLASSLASLAPAADQDPVFVAVLPVQSSQGMAEARTALVLETVRAQLPAEQIIVVPQDHVGTALAELGTSCGGPAECQKALSQRLEAQFLMKVVVNEPSAQDFEVTITIIDPVSATEVVSLDELCTICSEADLKRIVQERTLDARGALQRYLEPEDEEAAPVAEVAAPPPETRVEVRVEKGSPLVPTGWGLIGGGAAATIGGVVLLSLAGQDAGCPDDPRGGPCIPLVYETVLPGAIVGGVGLALVGTGVGLVVAGKKRNKSGEDTARVGFGPGTVTVSGRF